MVFPDIYSNKKYEVPTVQRDIPATLVDRFFSFVIDYFVLSPFVLFVLYSTFHNGFAFWKQNPEAPESNIFLGLLILCYVFYFAFAQSLFVIVMQATPGQYYLKLSLQSEDQNKEMYFLRVLCRQLLFWLSFPLFGLPFLSMLTNPRRLTFYDRVSGLQVASAKPSIELFDFGVERRYWQALMSTLVIFCSFLLSAFIWKSYSGVEHRDFSLSRLQNQNYFCEEMGDSLKSEARLRTAVGLNLVNQLSDSCLDKEADFVLWAHPDSTLVSLAYYAKSLTTTDQHKERLYQQQACADEETRAFAENSLGCRLSTAFLTADFNSLYASLKGADFLSDLLRYELSQELDKTPQIEKQNFERLAQHDELKLMRKYELKELLLSPDSASSGRLPASVETHSNDERVQDWLDEL